MFFVILTTEIPIEMKVHCLYKKQISFLKMHVRMNTIANKYIDLQFSST